MNILVIHGFNSAPGSKSKDLELAFPNANIFSPQLTNNPFIDVSVLEDFIDNNRNIHVVGTSLGAFYTMYLAVIHYQHREDISYYIINPSYTPYDNFKFKVGEEFTNYKTNSKFKVNDRFVNELNLLQDIVHSLFVNYPNMYFYFGDNDEVLNHDDLKDKIKSFKSPYNIFTSNQDHRHEDISSIISQIKINSLEL
jgi:predicted esterase YcpF (UPF0227 family)